MLSRNARIGVHHARRAREALGVGLGDPLPDLLRAVEAIGAPVAVLELAEGVAGAWIAGSIFVNGDHSLVRQRFTLAHELGHVRLGHAPVVDHLGALAMSGAGAVDEEVQANTFAAEFLVPRAAVEGRFGGPVTLEEVVRLAAEFGVSSQMARIRFETVGLLRDRAQIEKLDGEIRDGLAKQLAGLLGCETPRDGLAQLRIPRLPARPSALAAYLGGEIGLEQLAAAAGSSRAEMRTTLARWGLTRS